MSTILDALRKLQHEREAAGRQRRALPPMAAAARGRRSWGWIAAVAVLLLGGAVSGYWLMGIRDQPAPRQVAQIDPSEEGRAASQVSEAARQRGARPLSAARSPQVAPRAEPQPSKPADLPKLATPEPATEPAIALREPEPQGNQVAGAALAPRVEKKPAPAAPPPVPPTPEPAKAAAVIEEPEVTKPATAEPQVAKSEVAKPAVAKPEVVAAPVVKAASPPPAGTPPSPPEKVVRAETPPPAPLAKREPPPPVVKPAAPAARPSPPARRRAPAASEPGPEPEPEPEHEFDPEIAVAETRAAASVAASFPHVIVESVRWHPDPVRRVARLQLPTLVVDEAREGEEYAGVFVHRIEPAAVEVGYRGARQLIRMGR